MPAIRINGRDYEELAIRQIRDPVTTNITSLALPPNAATETTLVQVRDAIKATIDLESTIWTDNSGAYYVRRDTVNEGTGAITISWTAPDGTAATPGAGLKPLATAERDVTQALFVATDNGTGYSTNDFLARLLILDVNATTPVITQVWYNLSTNAVITAPSAAHVTPSDESVVVASSALPAGASTSARQDTLIGHVDGIEGLLTTIDVDTGNIDGKLPSGLTVSSTRLLVDGSGVTQPTSVAVRTPTTTSVASSASSVTLLALNANRRGLSIANVSTATLSLSFSTPATAANCFAQIPANGFLLLDQQLIVTNAIYGIWSSANGTAQVTEYV